MEVLRHFSSFHPAWPNPPDGRGGASAAAWHALTLTSCSPFWDGWLAPPPPTPWRHGSTRLDVPAHCRGGRPPQRPRAPQRIHREPPARFELPLQTARRAREARRRRRVGRPYGRGIPRHLPPPRPV